jgi:hypothetical protein
MGRFKLILMLCIAVGIGAGLATYCPWVLPEKAITEGDKPYTPTRLEWLAVEAEHLTESMPRDFDDTMMARAFMPLAGKNTIHLIVTCRKGTQRAAVDEVLEDMRGSVNNIAKMRGWDGWVKIKTLAMPLAF